MISCLLIIDVQKGFINKRTKKIPAIVEALQSYFRNVFIFRVVNAPRSPFRKLLKWKRFGIGTKDTELAFKPCARAEIFEKRVYTCVDEKFLRLLKKRKISEVFLCGIDTDCCVLKTAVDLFEAGLRPVVLSKACASHESLEHHKASLKILRRLIGVKQVVYAAVPFVAARNGAVAHSFALFVARQEIIASWSGLDSLKALRFEDLQK
jgi:nicotinamidase-related amidase